MHRALIALVTPFALAACNQPREIRIENPWVRAGAVPGRPAAAYLTLKGGPRDNTLIAVSSDVAIRAELHETMQAGGMSNMKPLAAVPVPAGSTVAFAPGGRHIMLFDINPRLHQGEPVLLRLTFANGLVLESNAPIVPAGAPAPY